MSTVEQKYVMTKLGTSDYALPSNDAKKLFRIRMELDTEDLYEGAPSQGWVIREYNRPLTGGTLFLFGDNWDYWGGPYKTRKEAVDACLT